MYVMCSNNNLRATENLIMSNSQMPLRPYTESESDPDAGTELHRRTKEIGLPK